MNLFQTYVSESILMSFHQINFVFSFKSLILDLVVVNTIFNLTLV